MLHDHIFSGISFTSRERHGLKMAHVHHYFFLGTFYSHFSSLTFQPPKPPYQFQKPVSKSVSKPVSKLISKPVSNPFQNQFIPSFKIPFLIQFQTQFQNPVSKTSFKKCLYKVPFLRRLVIVKRSFTCFCLWCLKTEY